MSRQIDYYYDAIAGQYYQVRWGVGYWWDSRRAGWAFFTRDDWPEGIVPIREEDLPAAARPLRGCALRFPALKPPIGLRPKHIVAQHRALEILAACKRYAQAAKQIPQEWLDELTEVNRGR